MPVGRLCCRAEEIVAACMKSQQSCLPQTGRGTQAAWDPRPWASKNLTTRFFLPLWCCENSKSEGWALAHSVRRGQGAVRAWLDI